MKFVIISNLYPPLLRGGAEMVAAQEAEALKAAWQHVTVLTTKPKQIDIGGFNVKANNKLVWQDEVNGVSVHRFTPVNLFYYLDDYKFPSVVRLLWHLFDTFNIFSYFKVKKFLLSEKPDVVITHNLMGLGFLTPYLLRKMKIKHFHTLHDVQLYTPSGLILKNQENHWQHRLFKLFAYPSLMKKLFASPALIISPSRFLLNFYQERGFFPKSKLVLLPNPSPAPMALARQASVNLELLYLGQVNQAKGVLKLIETMSKIHLPHLHLHIVGIGTDLAKAKILAKDDKRIIFHGWLPHKKLIPILSKIDMVVVPSLCYENSPLVVYESLSFGLPVLAADIGGVAELIKEGVNGWSFPADNWEALADKINKLYLQRDKIRLLAPNCRASVAQFSIKNYIDQILSLAENE